MPHDDRLSPLRDDDNVRPGDPDAPRPGSSEARDDRAAQGGTVGAAAGLAVGSLLGGPFGAIAGAFTGALGGWFSSRESSEVRYDEAQDAHYRALYEGSPHRVADRGFEHARPAYQLGHLAAHNPEWAGRSFDDVEPDLRRGWSDDLHTRHGAWDAVRPHVRDAWGHARTQGAGVRRDATVIGSAGSAVDPVELDRAQRGLPSVDTRGGELEGR